MTRVRLVTRKAFWISYAIVLGFQLVVNGVLTGLPVVRYRPSAIIGCAAGLRAGRGPAVRVRLVLLTLTIWVWLGPARGRPSDARPARAPATAAARGASPTDDPAREHVVVGPLDLVEDAAVERERGAQARPRGRVHQLDTRLGARRRSARVRAIS